MKRKRLDPNKKSYKLYGDSFEHNLKQRQALLHDMCMPINEMLWYQGGNFINDMFISFLDFRYVQYSEFINQSTKPFKKHED